VFTWHSASRFVVWVSRYISHVLTGLQDGLPTFGHQSTQTASSARYKKIFFLECNARYKKIVWFRSLLGSITGRSQNLGSFGYSY
jgi:hypothetical protein